MNYNRVVKGTTLQDVLTVIFFPTTKNNYLIFLL